MPESLPTGPIEVEPLDYPTPDYPSAAYREQLLTETLAAAGVDLGAYDRRIIEWFAGHSDWSTFAVMASWVQRAAAHAE